MKLRILPLFVTAILFLAFSCTKKGNNPIFPQSTDLDYGYFSNWTLTDSKGTSEHQAHSVTVQSDGYYSCYNDTSLQVFFGDPLVPETGKYHIVSEARAANHTLGTHEVAFECNWGASDVYLSLDGNDSADIVVTDKGFRHLYLHKSKVIHVNNGQMLDSAMVIGDISFPDHKQ
ncbi:MAG: hypothetical protein JST82_15770 [Bacteroidetes bacterium]|nr:hypothetical protein [Bacteroidota bacterium]